MIPSSLRHAAIQYRQTCPVARHIRDDHGPTNSCVVSTVSDDSHEREVAVIAMGARFTPSFVSRQSSDARLPVSLSDECKVKRGTRAAPVAPARFLR